MCMSHNRSQMCTRNSSKISLDFEGLTHSTPALSVCALIFTTQSEQYVIVVSNSVATANEIFKFMHAFVNKITI